MLSSSRSNATDRYSLYTYQLPTIPQAKARFRCTISKPFHHASLLETKSHNPSSSHIRYSPSTTHQTPKPCLTNPAKTPTKLPPPTHLPTPSTTYTTSTPSPGPFPPPAKTSSAPGPHCKKPSTPRSSSSTHSKSAIYCRAGLVKLMLRSTCSTAVGSRGLCLRIRMCI